MARALSRALPLLLILLAAAPAVTQDAPPDLYVTVFSEPGKDRVAVAYSDQASPARIKQDFAEIARNLGSGPPSVKVSVSEGIPAAEAEFAGLTDWSTGAVNLNPLIQVYKRYGRFRASFFFLGNFPEQPVRSFEQGPLKVEGERTGNVISYRVSIDQSKGEPSTVPAVTSNPPPDRKWIVGLAALSVVVAVTVFLVVFVLQGQRRRSGAAAAAEPAATGSGSAAASGSTREGK